MTYQIGILGLGLMGTRMARAMQASKDFRIAAAFDADSKANELFHAEFHATVQGSAQELIAAPGLDLIYIATPPSSHVGFLRDTFDRGLPALVEKPLATDLQETREFCRAFPAARAWIHFPMATLGGLESIESQLKSKLAGKPLRVEINLQFSQWPRTWHHAGPWLSGPREGGFVREVFSHFAYLTQRVLGPLDLQWKEVQYGSKGTETQVQAHFLCGQIPVSLAAGVGGGAPDHNRWTLFCEDRSYRVEDWSQVSWAHSESWQPFAPEELTQPAGMVGFLGRLGAALEGKDDTLPRLDDGLVVMEAVEGILAR